VAGYRFLEHTADVVVEAWGFSLEEAFANAAKATFEVMTDTSKVEPAVEKLVEVEGFDLENLLLRWIEELLVIFDSEGLLLSSFDVHKISRAGESYRLEAVVRGEKFDPSKHEPRTHIKAATYAQMKIWQEGGKWYVRFVLDI